MELHELALPGLHDAFYRFISHALDKPRLRILDLGAGEGLFTKNLYERGHDVQACDLFPERYRYSKVKCSKVDLDKPWSIYANNSFDVLVALETVEHLTNIGLFFSESNRILKPNGKLFLSTPNILFLKSRLSFLINGYSHGFEASDSYGGMEHVIPLTPKQIAYIANKNNLQLTNDDSYGVSRISRMMKPLRYILPKNPYNSNRLLDSLSLFMEFTKKPV
jgi:2-polyprenyl-3-methyl-5-hydroxy-6-metoxy-1,4-benzoquinol methylase